MIKSQKYQMNTIALFLIMAFVMVNTLQDIDVLESSSFPNENEGNIRILQSDQNQNPYILDVKSRAADLMKNTKQKLQFGTFSEESNATLPNESSPNSQKNQDSKIQQSSNDNQPTIPLTQVNKSVIGKGFKIDNGVSYQRIHIKDLSKKYLFLDFKLSQKDKWQQANITVTLQGSNQVLAICTFDGYDSCYISQSFLKENVNIFLYIKCEDDCTYNLKGRWSDMEHITPGQDFIFMFGEEKSQLFHVQLQKEEFEEVRIHFSPRTTRKPFDNIKAYGTYGSQNSPTETKYDFKSVNLWEDGQGIFLSRKNMKSQEFILFVVGQSETTYRLTCELVRDKIHEIENNEHLYEYLEPKQTRKYFVRLADIATFEEYSLKFSILSGEAEIKYYTDSDLTKQFPVNPLEYMKDSEYIIPRRELSRLSLSENGIFIKVSTSKRSATYTLKFVGITSSAPIQMHQHVYSFIPAFIKPRFAYFNYKEWISQTQEKKNMKFTVSMIQVLGKVNIQFRVCKTTFQQCINPAFFDNFTNPLKITNTEKISEKQVYQFTISNEILTKINSIEEETNIIVKLTPQPQSKSENNLTLSINIVALQFVNNNKMFLLRQGRPFEQKFEAGETKYYKYINSDSDVEQIRIHINLISGNVRTEGLIKSSESAESIKVSPQANTLKFTQHLSKPIFMSISADTKSIVGISMQVIHKSDTKKGVNLITIGQDLTYTFKIQPEQFMIVEVVPIFYEFNFFYSASHSVMACLLNMATNKCMDANGTEIVAPAYSLKQVIKGMNADIAGRKARIQILNPFSDHSTEVTVIFHSRDISDCRQKKMGKLYNQVAEDGSCIYYILDDNNKNGLQIYVSKRQYSKIAYTVFLCGNSIQGSLSQKILRINSTIVKQKCSRSLEGWRATIYWDFKSSEEISTVKVDFLAQYEGGVTIVPEGVAYHAVEQSKSSFLRKFGFKVLNKVSTKIIINAFRGYFKAFAKIIQEVDRDSQQISNINYHFQSSQDSDYRQQPIITITAKEMQQAVCADCLILIAVYTTSDEGSVVEFQLQVVQKVQNLNDNTALVGYLQADSFAYYVYDTNRQPNVTMMFVLSDHNLRCANLFLGEREYPNAQFNMASSYNKSLLSYQHSGGEKRYFLTVQSTKVCQYSVTVVTADTSIVKLQKGRQILVLLLKGHKQYFIFENYNEPFKIFALSKFGQVKFYLNKSNIEVNKNAFTTNELNTNQFEYSSQLPNILAISEKDRIFCTFCSYFVVIEALKNTVSTLFLASPLTIIPLIEKKYFSDFLEKIGNYTLLSYKRLEKTQLSITVHTGEIDVTVVYKQTRFSQTFSAKSEHQSMVIDVNKAPSNKKHIPESDPHLGKQVNTTIRYTQRVPINIIITSKADRSTYTLLATSMQRPNLNDVASYQSILAGEPNHITISSSKVSCLQGYYRESDEEIIITVNSDHQKMLNNLIINAQINKLDAVVQTSIIKNMITIKLTASDGIYDGASYEVCLKYDNSKDDSVNEENLSNEMVKEIPNDDADELTLKAVVTQVNTINLLSSDTESIIKGESTLTIYHEGQFLLDVFQCQADGEAVIHYGKSIKSITSSAGKSIQSIGMTDQKHAIKITEQSSATYVKIKSKLSVVRWLPIDYEKDEGTGYMKFAIGDLRYTSKFKQVIVEFQPLQNIKASKSFIKEVQYTILISNDSKQLNKVSQCDSENHTNVMIIPLEKLNNPLKSLEKTYSIYQVDKQLLQLAFPTDANIYLTLIAKLTLELNADAKMGQKHRNPSSDEHEHYRFIYNRQQMPLQAYKQSQIESIPYHFLILLVMSIAGLFLLMTYVFTRKIIPLIARVKTSNLVQEKEAHPQIELAEVPPSSDRNQRAPDIAIETEEGLKK